MMTRTPGPLLPTPRAQPSASLCTPSASTADSLSHHMGYRLSTKGPGHATWEAFSVAL
jgi:hypothetical protein